MLFEPNLDALANMGKHFEQLVKAKDNASIAACKQRYLDYLHRMLSSMKSIYFVPSSPLRSH